MEADVVSVGTHLERLVFEGFHGGLAAQREGVGGGAQRRLHGHHKLLSVLLDLSHWLHVTHDADESVWHSWEMHEIHTDRQTASQ